MFSPPSSLCRQPLFSDLRPPQIVPPLQPHTRIANPRNISAHSQNLCHVQFCLVTLPSHITTTAMLRTAPRVAARASRCSSARPRPLLPTQFSRPLSVSIPRMSQLPTVSPPVSSTLPSDSFQLLPTESKAGAAEDALFDTQVQQVQEWWKSPRYAGIKRPYTAEDVVARRGALQQTYPSSLMARKLFNLFEERAKEGKPVHTSEYLHRLRRRISDDP